jgi:hypothetical protein
MNHEPMTKNEIMILAIATFRTSRQWLNQIQEELGPDAYEHLRDDSGEAQKFYSRNVRLWLDSSGVIRFLSENCGVSVPADLQHYFPGCKVSP